MARVPHIPRQRPDDEQRPADDKNVHAAPCVKSFSASSLINSRCAIVSCHAVGEVSGDQIIWMIAVDLSVQPRRGLLLL